MAEGGGGAQIKVPLGAAVVGPAGEWFEKRGQPPLPTRLTRARSLRTSSPRPRRLLLSRLKRSRAVRGDRSRPHTALASARPPAQGRQGFRSTAAKGREETTSRLHPVIGTQSSRSRRST